MEIVQVKEKSKNGLWANVLHTLLAWRQAAGWRKASKCKKLIVQLKAHLSFQRARRGAIIRQSNADIAQCIYKGLRQQALMRAEQLYKDHCLVSAYDHINELCQCLEANISHIRKHSDAELLPHNVNQAIASLIFAASRYGLFPELNEIRNLLRDRYGKKYETTNVELLPGNLVSSRIREKLCVTSIPHEEKLKLLDKISAEDPLLQHLAKQNSRPRQEKIRSHSTEPGKCMQKAEAMDFKNRAASWSRGDEGRNSPAASNFIEPKKDGLNYYTMYKHSSTSGANNLKSEVTRGHQRTSAVNSANHQAGNPRNVRTTEDSGNVIASSGYMTRTPMKPTSSPKSVRSRTQPKTFSRVDPGGNNGGQMGEKNCTSLDIPAWKAQNGTSPSHVHPNLPEYDVLKAKIAYLRNEDRTRTSLYH